ncbi:hypothetical protein CC85DRAFT_330491 [Cutaneotrichosporon oleaginosum]|uniref:RRM domain-containing protein n=1 Tax=Cutaneotrichosporon oleaginosum TaxID=879819 RepID=A0A0J0XFB3_9TREE|nr:uncharacterized protein CC85DRAFT_330491 [Cutaneotrichosporon oleaginosum]KLT39738.1 hypothetical protein CC85DRAFT_330491 [Cutaneotrichosporon oleaginosum]TXT12252.1 hypothetical protein COLE_02662 [Cutaneotrichosporon oleaginosum]
MSAPPPIWGKFEQDPRAHVDKITGKWQYEDEQTGQEYEWTGKTWIALVPAAPVLAREEKIKKRKAGDKENNREARPAKVQMTGPKSKKTAVWVSNLPPNTTVDLLQSVFSKAGVLHVDDQGKPRIKLYYDDDGKFKGDALVMYFKEGSVDLAITLLDDTELELGAGYGNMRVRVAEYDRSETSEANPEPAQKATHQPPQKKPLTAEEKSRMKRRMRQLESKLTWHSDDDDDGARASSNISSQLGRVVVLKGMFKLRELEEEPELILELKEDVREEAETLGAVTSVVLYDKEEEGVMTVKFKDPVAAQACVKKMDGRYFGGQRVSAAIFSGKERFRKSGGLSFGEDLEEQERLDKFAEWIAESED